MLKQWLKLSNQEADLKKNASNARRPGCCGRQGLCQIPRLTEDEVKALVVDDKWLAALDTMIHGEMDRVSQARRPAGRRRNWPERHETPMPRLAERVAELEAKVGRPLERRGILASRNAQCSARRVLVPPTSRSSILSDRLRGSSLRKRRHRPAGRSTSASPCATDSSAVTSPSTNFEAKTAPPTAKGCSPRFVAELHSPAEGEQHQPPPALSLSCSSTGTTPCNSGVAGPTIRSLLPKGVSSDVSKVGTLSPQFLSLLPEGGSAEMPIVGTASPQSSLPAETLLNRLSYTPFGTDRGSG